MSYTAASTSCDPVLSGYEPKTFQACSAMSASDFTMSLISKKLKLLQMSKRLKIQASGLLYMIIKVGKMILVVWVQLQI